MNLRISSTGIKMVCVPALLASMQTTLFAADLRLVEAAQKQEPAAIAALVKEGVDVNAAQPDGATALHWAAQWNDLVAASLLVRARAQVNAANSYGVTPLALACLNGNAEMAALLLQAGANPNAMQKSGESALMTAARAGNARIVEELLARKADPNANESRRGQTALMWAVEQNHFDVARALLRGGADVHARSKSGFTALLFAGQQGNINTARLLLESGAKVNDSATEFGTALVVATARGREAFALFLLEQGADPNAADKDGLTAMHYALLEGMANISAVPGHLAVASFMFRPSMKTLLTALLDRGGNINARVKTDPVLPGSTPRFGMAGATPFFLAVGTGEIELVRYLLDRGADPKIATTQNTTALMVAAGLGNFEDRTARQDAESLAIAKLLLDLGADVNAVGENGWTALHGAAYTGTEAIIRFLVERGARMDVRDVFEQTPLSIAQGLIGIKVANFTKKPFGPHPSAAGLLLSLGASPTAAITIPTTGVAPVKAVLP
ncbi:MAG: hypothetical protein EXQ56_05220 [Acidobacteria bacterium]|nr:hypothetical protein [Acidobacteriota bacterium]